MTDVNFPRLYAETLRHEHPESVAIIEADARRQLAEEIRAWAKSHGALKRGSGNVDDVIAFTDWLSAAHEEEGSDE